MAESGHLSFPPSVTVPGIENDVDTGLSDDKRVWSTCMTHLESVSSQTLRRFLSWTLVLLIAVTKEQYWCIYSHFEFSAGYAGKERYTCFDTRTAASALYRNDDRTANKGVSTLMSPVPNAPDVKVQCAPRINQKNSYMEGSWALERQCRSPGARCCCWPWWSFRLDKAE